ncbi:MAG: efflux RND transporter periplasmic adaptor subunit [Rhodanobacteraceae bacterium]
MLAAILSMAGCSSGSDNGDASQKSSATPGGVSLTAAQRQHIHLYTVASSTFHKTIDTTGVVDFDNDHATSVLAPFSGPVTRLLVTVGEKVRKGQPLAVVDSPDFASAVAAYRKASATAATARRLADLDKDLLAHHAIAQREEEQAQTDATGAESDRDAALQALVALNVDPRTIDNVRAGRVVARIEGTIRSPIAGTVVEKLITPGQLLQAGTTPCFTVADLSRAWVMAQIFGGDIDAVRVGDQARVSIDGDSRTITGTVTNVSALVDPNTRSVTARVSLDNPGDVLKKQMYVRVQIQSRQQNTGLLVPVSAVLRDDENLPFVYVVQSGGSFVRRGVTLGYRANDRNDITAGLRAGEQVVTEGGIFVQFMQTQ